jgi:hypothetical protein
LQSLLPLLQGCDERFYPAPKLLVSLKLWMVLLFLASRSLLLSTLEMVSLPHQLPLPLLLLL